MWTLIRGGGGGFAGDDLEGGDGVGVLVAGGTISGLAIGGLCTVCRPDFFHRTHSPKENSGLFVRSFRLVRSLKPPLFFSGGVSLSVSV